MIRPDFVIGDDYLRRWYLTRWSGWFRDRRWEDLRWWERLIRTLPNAYLHHVRRSDDDRALHDHPWWNVSVVLAGGYWEHQPTVGLRRRWRAAGLTEADPPYSLGLFGAEFERVWRGPGSVVLRRATDPHRLEVPPGRSCWSLFLTGPKVREWGFHCPMGWVHWRDFTSGPRGEHVGRGCE